MSLLIKALDNAEKNKQAEKEKKPQDESQAVKVPLELEAIEPKQSEQAGEAQQANSSPATPSYAMNHLTLEEEAGLTLALDSKYVKPKRGAEKTTAKSGSADDSKSAHKQVVAEKSSSNPASQSPASKNSSTKSPVLPPVFQNLAIQNTESEQKTAAKVFMANQAQKGTSKSALVILGVAGALLIWLGLHGYEYIKTMLAQPQPVVVTPVAVKPQEMASVAADAAQQGNTGTAVPESPTTINAAEVESPTELPANTATTAKSIKTEETAEPVVSTDSASGLTASTATANLVAEAKPLNKNKRSGSHNTNAVNTDEANAQEDGSANSIKLVRKSSLNGVDPTLSSAYQAYIRGDDTLAQQQYRQVLQRDVRNVDALLGMAAIAQRQNRDADAFGWYQKVLEIEPKNTIAQSALINAQATTDSSASESKIKSLLAQQPEAANLHAALGNLYASQNQWPAAQEAYFNASRYAPSNAAYAFNLAISLEQLGKPNLALIQYQRALELVSQSGAMSPDKAQISARIHALSN